MPAPPKDLKKAHFKEVKWNEDGTVEDVDGGFDFDVQFNPESLKLAYNSTKAGGDQSGGSAIQYVGQGTTKLTLDLIFDGSRDARAATEGNKPDVRNLTLELVNFIKPKEDAGDSTNLVAPGARISWGSFLFEGVVDSINETLDYWTEDGRPLQAKVSVSLSKQEVQVQPPTPFAADGGDSTGAIPMTPAREGDSVAEMAGREGNPADWKDIAAGNGIENPRSLAAGALIDLKAGISVGASASLGIGASGSLGGSASAGFGVSAGAGAAFDTGFGVSAGASAGLSGGAGVSARATSSLSARLTARAPMAEFSFELDTSI